VARARTVLEEALQLKPELARRIISSREYCALKAIMVRQQSGSRKS